MKKEIDLGIPLKGFKNVPRELKGRNSNRNRWTKILKGCTFAQCPDCSSILNLMIITYQFPSYRDLDGKWEDPEMELECKRCGYRVKGRGTISLDIQEGIYSINSFTIKEQKRKNQDILKRSLKLREGREV